MKFTIISLFCLAASLPLVAEPVAHEATEAAPKVAAALASPAQVAADNTQRLLTALRDGDRASFLENSSDRFQEAMTKELFTAARTKLMPILSQKSQLDFLGTLNKGTDTIYLYRLRPENGGIDSLVSTAIRDGVVTGFFMN